MATVMVDGETGPLLRDWLRGDWALLFSHPVDFQYQGLENDRWLSILREEFGARGVRPLACGREGAPRDGAPRDGARPGVAEIDAGWASDLTGDRSVLRLSPVEAASRSLRDDVLSMPPRFVLIIDGQLVRRGVLKYSAGRSSISPLDLLASIDALRRRNNIRIAA